MAEVNETKPMSSVEPHYPEPKEVKKRGRTQISADILRVCLSGALRTHIVYQANLNFNIIKPYLARLVSAGLLDPVGKYHYTTEAGKEYLYHAERVII